VNAWPIVLDELEVVPPDQMRPIVDDLHMSGVVQEPDVAGTHFDGVAQGGTGPQEVLVDSEVADLDAGARTQREGRVPRQLDREVEQLGHESVTDPSLSRLSLLLAVTHAREPLRGARLECGRDIVAVAVREPHEWQQHRERHGRLSFPHGGTISVRE
jgi:hypothetical protein